MLQEVSNLDLSGGLMSAILDNTSAKKPNPLIMIMHSRLIAATYEVHNYRRTHNLVFTSVDEGVKSFRRIMCDINLRRRTPKKKVKKE